MLDPVVIEDGMTYERAALEIWLGTHHSSPMTGERLTTKLMFPNSVLRSEIVEAREEVFLFF